MIRYRFSEFTLSPQRRLLVRDGQEVPLIPRYFDLLLLLVEHRREAVHRDEIFNRVWGDVSVSDSALSQAVRTIRRTLGDDSREPRFIRTVSRHGYQFVFPDVVEESEETDTAGRTVSSEVAAPRVELRSAPRWSTAAAGGAVAGIIAGSVGGVMLAAAPGSTAPFAIAPVLAVMGGALGWCGGAGVGAGITLAEDAAPSQRWLASTAGASLGGGAVGFAVQWLVRWGLSGLIGLDVPVGGGIEGIAIGAAAGLGYAVAGADRRTAALVIAVLCGMAGLALTLTGRPLAGGTINAIATAAEGSRVSLAPLGRLLGEPDFGQVTSAILAFGEAATFGVGLALGLVRRP